MQIKRGVAFRHRQGDRFREEGRAERAKENPITSSANAMRCSHWSTPFVAYTRLWSLYPRGF